MEFRILGPLEVVSEGDSVTIRGAKPRALLALFLVHANRVVARDRLIDDLWEGSPPESAVATLQTYVSQLRSSLGLESLHTRTRGYVLEVEAFELDALRFERVLDATPRARDLAPDSTAARLAEALSWWRGPALADFVARSGPTPRPPGSRSSGSMRSSAGPPPAWRWASTRRWCRRWSR